MANITPSEMRRMLEEQGLRVKDVDAGTWEVKAPEGANLEELTIKSGIVRVHHRGLRKEDSRWTAIIGELKKVGFDPTWIAPKANGQAQTDEDIERQTGLRMYRREAPPDDPDDRWVTFEEAAPEMGIGKSGVAQRVRVHGLRTVLLPVMRKGGYGATRTVQVLHVHLKDLKATGIGKQPRGRRPSVERTPVRSRFDTTTAAGRLSSAVARAKSAFRKMEAATEEFKAAAETIEAEAGGALQELHDLRQRQKDIEAAAERLIGKL